jgi:hypothetical protein
LRVVNGTGTHDHQEPIVRAVEDALDLPAGVVDGLCPFVADGELFLQRLGGGHLFDVADA